MKRANVATAGSQLSRLLRTHPLRAADALQLAAALSLVQGGVAGLVFLTADLRLAEAAEIEGLGVGR